jgi:hypothetical protein
MSRTMTLYFARAGRQVKLRLAKRLSSALNPLRHERGLQSLLSAVEYAGYTQLTHLKLVGESADNPLPIGIWNLLELPHGGELIVPTYRASRPRVLFGKVPAGALETGNQSVRMRMNLVGEQKIAIRAAAVTGRLGYVYRAGVHWSLVVRNFNVNPSGEYVDVPKDEPTDFGYAVHAVNVHSALGRFCELEYHAPALGLDPQQTEATDVSQVWAFRGPKAAIGRLGACLLGVSLFPAIGGGR